MAETLSIYMIPPLLTLIAGLFLAALGFSIRRKVLFPLVCIWYTLLTPLFLLHPFIDDAVLMMAIERCFHFIYVYFPLVQVLFTHKILRIKRPKVVQGVAVGSFLVSLSVPTDYYFNGFCYYGWGYISRGGLAFDLFGIYGTIVFLYCSYCYIYQLRREANSQLKLKYGYLLFGFGLSSILTILNMPAVKGIDFYPFGNFTFIPLSILAYGIFRHRMLEARTILRVAWVWTILTILILGPHYFLLRRLWPYINVYSVDKFFWVAAVWFMAIYFHGRLMFKAVWFGFYRQRQRLKRLKRSLLKKMPVLGNSNDLIDKVSRAICKTIPFPWLQIYPFDPAAQTLVTVDEEPVTLSPALQQWLLQSVRIIEMSVMTVHGNTPEVANPPKELLHRLKAEYLIPLIHDDGLVGVLVMPSKSNGRQITPDEARFFMEITRTFSLALSNAVMFQRVLTLKERLQARTKDLTQEVAERTRVEETMQALQKELQSANVELERAILQANEMTAKAEIGNYVLAKEAEERKAVEEALRQSEERYRLIAENSTDVIWTIDLNNCFTYMSPSVEYLLGYTPEEMMQFKINDVLTPESMQRAAEVVLEEIEKENNFNPDVPRYRTRKTEVQQVHKNGTVIWTEVNSCFVRDSQRNILGVLGVTRDISGRKKSEQELIYMAYHDALTGLYNRKAFYEQMAKDIKYARRYNAGLALLLLDLNNFKHVNDTHGHHTGDLLLQTVAERLQTVLRETDGIARLGGDEFTIILKTPDKIETEQVILRIAAELETPITLDGIYLDDLGASIGMAVFPEDGESVDALVRSADAAMYRDKAAGKK